MDEPLVYQLLCITALRSLEHSQVVFAHFVSVVNQWHRWLATFGLDNR